jgi:hypothetical protein
MSRNIQYRIGAKYKYPDSCDILTLDRVKGGRFIFKCGHWCTDSVFVDLIDIKKKMQVYKLMHMTIQF